jgi:hypothetical protein
MAIAINHKEPTMPKPPHPHHPHNKPKPNPRPHNPKGIPFATRLLDANLNSSLIVDGSTSPIDYQFVPADDLTVTELALIFEDNGQLAYGDKFLSLAALTNGILIELQSYGQVVRAPFSTTRDLIEYASPGGFYTDSGGGRYIVKAARHFTQGLQLRDRHQDYIKLTVADNLTGLAHGVASVLGYTD